MKKRALFATTCCTVLLGMSSAWADDPRARSAELYEKGNKLFDEQKYSEAEAAYQAAWDLRKSFDLAGNLAEVEMQLEQYRDAAEHFSYALREFPAGGKPEVREALTKRFEEARAQVGAVKITTNVGGAKIVVDGKDVGQAPLPEAVFVDPGTRVIEARLAGHDDVLRTVQVEKGSSQEVNLVMVPKMGSGGGIVVGSGGAKKSLPIIIAGAGLAAVGIGTGIGLIVAAGGKSSDASDLRKELSPGDCPGTIPTVRDKCSTLKGQLEDKDTFQNVGTGVLIAGGVIAAGTVVYALWPAKRSAPTTGWQVVPTVAPTFAGLSASGHF
ncbi:PEGA domain-containing protein [Polyangium aurulentum]|uniref:PEGA domain-containing protein n=1 Tax=Polyangium aurulentum TaxID=2567896 RepID=UPI0010ADA681|nr:PEGA domain-containing protein [Polyangium aurulentum]UQA59149.1 PEGA domain-containing protein [Polyangium aurulentum]